MPDVGWPELLIILVVALVIFGPKRLPDLGKSLGKGIREFKNGINGLHEHLESEGDQASEAQHVAASAPVSEIRPGEVMGGEVVREETVRPQQTETPAAGWPGPGCPFIASPASRPSSPPFQGGGHGRLVRSAEASRYRSRQA